MHSPILATLAAFILSAQSLMAGPVVPVSLEPINHMSAALVVVAEDGTELSYSPEELEEFTTYSITTVTPWRDVPAQFDGVLLADILSAAGLDSVGSIKVTAENDYTTVLNRDLWESVDILVATRVDGRPHTRRARGPIQFVIDNDAYHESDLTSDSNFVWMAARIEASNS